MRITKKKALIVTGILAVAFTLICVTAVIAAISEGFAQMSASASSVESDVCVPINITGTVSGSKITLDITGGIEASDLKGKVKSNGTFSISMGSEDSVVKMSLPPSPPARIDFFSYMPQFDQSLYTIQLDKSSRQYKLNQRCRNDKAGFRRYEDDYLVALGSYYGNHAGNDRFKMKFKQPNGKTITITAMLGDVKSDKETDSKHQYHANGDKTVVEFIMSDRNSNNNSIINSKFDELLSISKIGMDIELEGKIVGNEITITGTANGTPLSASGTVQNGKIDATGIYGSASGLMLWPCNSSAPITSPFGYRIHPVYGTYTGHTGLDIGIPTGSTVTAAKDGRVTIAGTYGGYGYAVMIDHGNGLSTLYGHNSMVKVRVGQQVKAGQVVALSGNSGVSTGPHLHFEVRVNGEPKDPMSYLTKK